jgi:hypothetical protein
MSEWRRLLLERRLLADFVAKVVCWLGGDCIEFFDGDG